MRLFIVSLVAACALLVAMATSALATGTDSHFPEGVTVTTLHEPYLETRLYAPLVRLIHRSAGGLLMRLQAGSIHQYLLYIGLALALLLWLGYRG